jgi:hypothetical protein
MAAGTRFKTTISTGLLTMALLVAASAGIAYATIPDASSQYHACVLTAVGQVRIIDHDAGANCKESEQHVHWSQVGPPDAQGPAGPIGPAGQAGPPGPQGETGSQGPPCRHARLASQRGRYSRPLCSHPGASACLVGIRGIRIGRLGH